MFVFMAMEQKKTNCYFTRQRITVVLSYILGFPKSLHEISLPTCKVGKWGSNIDFWAKTDHRKFFWADFGKFGPILPKNHQKSHFFEIFFHFSAFFHHENILLDDLNIDTYVGRSFWHFCGHFWQFFGKIGNFA